MGSSGRRVTGLWGLSVRRLLRTASHSSPAVIQCSRIVFILISQRRKDKLNHICKVTQVESKRTEPTTTMTRQSQASTHGSLLSMGAFCPWESSANGSLLSTGIYCPWEPSVHGSLLPTGASSTWKRCGDLQEERALPPRPLSGGSSQDQL